MNVFIVYAHHDPNSFSRAMLDRALVALGEEGHAVRVSDLHAMGFKAVADDRDFTAPRPQGGPGSGTDYQSRQRVASRDGGYAPDIEAELGNLAWADAVVFVFPYYWFHAPAILKGWFERVLVYDRVYSNEHPTVGAYGRGGLRGKRALLGVTFGAPPSPADAGPSRTAERIEAIQNGVFNYAGLDALPPFFAWAVAHVDPGRRAAYLDEWDGRIRGLLSDEVELASADGPTPPPDVLLGRERRPGDRVRPYGGDRGIAGVVMAERLRPREGRAEELVAKLEPLVAAATRDRGTRVYSLLRRASPDAGGSEEIWLLQAFDDDVERERHARSAPFATILGEVGDLLVEPPEIIPLVPLASKGI